jgi:hypothetical protein
MKRLLSFAFLIALLTLATTTVSAQKSDFDGSWQLSMAKSVIPENLPVLSKIVVKIKGDSLLTERVYQAGDGQDYPFTENLALGGKEISLDVFNMPRKTKGSFSKDDGTISIESNTTVNGGSTDFISKETWKADKTANTLTITCKNSMGGEESTGTLVFVKSEEK